MSQNQSSYNASRRESQPSRPPGSGRPSQMQVALPYHRYDDPPRAGSSGRPSQMQVAIPSRRLKPESNNYNTQGRPSHTQYALPSRAAPQSSSGRPSQLQVALPEQRDVGSRRSVPAQSQLGEPQRTVRAPPALPSIREAEQSRYGPPSVSNRSMQSNETYRGSTAQAALPSIREPIGNQFEYETTRIGAQPQVIVSRPHAGVTHIVRPGEPHHFGNRTDSVRGEIICTLCICNNPDSHGDAYTMLNSPRGYGIDGRPINWQEAKKRMLEWHCRPQISHAQEVEATPYIFDAETARMALEHEERLMQDVRSGSNIAVNVAGNNMNWHNQDGHAKPHLTEGGAKTQFTRGGG
ncbi:hypothetical protein CC86DRAFT_377571 [Ophiobolus disseminans]|uniref:Uncharacterized protein n=1 Tax=Ophiobolus disseminans TaxID=1469910 RepID=A0A6A7AI70_9PLEO|nr:hypothetical protein CC86DRAFT_377571 [Ophiobolus disseminans]